MSPVTLSRFTFRTVLIYSFIAMFAVAFVIYVLFQARFLLAGPQIFTASLPTASEERLIVLEGQAKNIIRMSLNGRQIYTDKDGHFKEALVLENGYTVATLQAEDRYGRITTHTQEFVFTNPRAEDVVIN
jgi:hypothetical protein